LVVITVRVNFSRVICSGCKRRYRVGFGRGQKVAPATYRADIFISIASLIKLFSQLVDIHIAELLAQRADGRIGSNKYLSN
jgi:hypothetical protein